MPRYIITIRKHVNPEPACYYLSKSGFRCYTAANAYVYKSLDAALADREHFAPLMPEYSLTVERLPPRLGVNQAVLRSTPIGDR